MKNIICLLGLVFSSFIAQARTLNITHDVQTSIDSWVSISEAQYSVLGDSNNEAEFVANGNVLKETIFSVDILPALTVGFNTFNLRVSHTQKWPDRLDDIYYPWQGELVLNKTDGTSQKFELICNNNEQPTCYDKNTAGSFVLWFSTEE